MHLYVDRKDVQLICCAELSSCSAFIENSTCNDYGQKDELERGLILYLVVFFIDCS